MGTSIEERSWRLYPRRMASQKRQQAAHERAVLRKASSKGGTVTKKKLKAMMLNDRRSAERKARHEKYANKAKTLVYG